MPHRLFIAINLPENIKEKLISFQKKIDEKFSSLGEEVSQAGIIRWTKKDNLHITLIFLGYLGDKELATIFKVVKEVVSKYQPFSINLKQICYGPKEKMPPRMIWVVGERFKTLALLKEDLEKSLIDSGIRFSLEEREFTPHITLGRIRTWLWRQIEPEERPEILEDISLDFEVKSIEVMESKLKRGGAEYTVLISALLTN